jgi:hypothetical protein
LEVRSEPSSRHRFETDGERTALVTGVDELEEEIAAAGCHREISDLIDDQQGEATEEADLFVEHALALGLCEGPDQIGEGGEVDAPAGFYRLDAERDRKMAFAGARRAEEVERLTAIDEAELGQRHDAISIQGGLEREVEFGERLDGREARHDERGLDATTLAQGKLLGEQRVDRFESGHLAALEATDRGVEDLERPRHPEPHKRAADTIGQWRRPRHRGGSDPAAIRRATAS